LYAGRVFGRRNLEHPEWNKRNFIWDALECLFNTAHNNQRTLICSPDFQLATILRMYLDRNKTRSQDALWSIWLLPFRESMMRIADGQILRIRRTQVLLVGSVKSKLYFHTNLHTYRSAIFQGRIEAPLFHGLHCLGIQTEAQSMDHSNVARMTGCVDNQP